MHIVSTNGKTDRVSHNRHVARSDDEFVSFLVSHSKKTRHRHVNILTGTDSKGEHDILYDTLPHGMVIVEGWSEHHYRIS